MAERIYIADKETLDKTHANTTAILASLEDPDGKHKNAVRYGIKISKTESNPKNRVTYLYDAEGMTPAAMDYTNGVFNYGSWEGVGFAAPDKNYPCMVKYDGTEAYKLNPNDYSKKADGSTSEVSDLNFGGNAMAAFVGGWLCQYETATDEYIIWSNVRWDDSYNAEHRTDANGVERPGFYRRIYIPTLYNNVARSISGQLSMYSKNATQERTYIKANGDNWEHTSWSEYNYIISLLKIMAKTDDLKTAYGKGNMNGYVNDAAQHYGVLQAGTLDTQGQFFGYTATNKQVKVFHTEAIWGDQWERLVGLICKNGKLLVSMHGPYNFTGEGYHEIYDYVEKTGITAATGGWARDSICTEYGRITVTWNGASNTYLTAYFYINPTITAVAIVGGSASNGANCGFYVNLNNSAGVADWDIAPGLSSKMPLAA